MLITVIPSNISALKKIRSILTREEKLKWLIIVAFTVCLSILEVITASVIVLFAQVLILPEKGQYYLSKIGLHDQISQSQSILYIAILCGLTYFIKNFFAAIDAFHLNFSIQEMNYNFKNKMLHRYAQSDYASYISKNSMHGYNVVSGDVELMFNNAMLAIATLLSEGMISSFLIAMVIYMNPPLAIIIFGFGVCVWLSLSKGLLPQFYRWGKRTQESALYSSQNLLQFFHAFKEIALLGKRDSFVDAYKFYSKNQSKLRAVQSTTNALPRMIIEVIFVGLFVFSIVFLCMRNENSNQLIGVLGGYLYAGFRIMPGLNRIINQLNVFKSSIPSIERVYSEYNTVVSKESYLDIKDFSFNESISLNNLFYSYPNTKKNALININLIINKGDCIGIIGETGSGKSTLSDIILGFLKPTDGIILIDKKYPVTSLQWHNIIGYVPQSIYLIDDSIEANIAFGETSEKINSSNLSEAIKASQLSKFIDNLPNGIKTFVGERGVRLSGGERQRIAIARALYRNPEVLIFDEATSALDNETEAKLIETIHNVSKNRTVIMIAHRLTTLKNCDRVIVLKSGIIENELSYKELIHQAVI
ncbi:ABC transporter ATP-binding protein [Fluviispira multicolorata]|uniref:ATP-binding cassette domain-containing protein n=1 Tax=Fluviispira multicolorata TaxID=2654512 RepID=A0A833JBD4_9BACT|nr:ABC transporter ATP-binding protein [Fluviispira multicolorata]KAB8028010.1 ATP-binding cassette domain-containing protein [Fluviispira multicolorata]